MRSTCRPGVSGAWVGEVLRHKLIDVVVVAIVDAVDVAKPAVPACPLPVAYPTLSEANHPATMGIDAIAEVEVLYLYLMLTRYDGSNDVLMLADGGEGGIVLDPAQHVGYTTGVQCDTKSHEGSGSKNGPGIVFDPVAIRRVRSR
jgi:hypothetical protein